ncbi:hypothetical protein AB0K02_33335 [Streptomyces sp. NPDC049597]|uniref:COG1470 family protein n=1 Tax=Streptomyces sp. NPDC049597 TaxID=3155276 RepID=UPI00342BC5E5
MRAAVVLVLALTAAPLLPAPAAAAAGAWGPDRAYLYLEGAPGAVLEDRLAVTNRDGEPVTLRLRADAAGPWIAFAARTVTVPARTRAQVPFTVTLPASTPPGGQTATITASGAGREEAVRLHLRVRGPLVAALTVEDVSYADGSIRYSLVNRGNTPLTPRVALRVDGLLGEVLSRPARVPTELPPGRRVTLSEPWSDPPHLDAVDIRVTASAPGAARAEATASRTFAAWPATATLLTGAVTAAALVLRRRVPSRRRGRTVPERRPAGAGA